MFYHLSSNYLGETIWLTPKIPTSSDISMEGDIPRVCFSTDIKLCIKSICNKTGLINELSQLTIGDLTTLVLQVIKKENTEELEKRLNSGKDIKDLIAVINPSVYKKICKSPIYTPPDHSDFRSNNEHWVLKKTKVKFLGYLDLAVLIKNKEVMLTDKESTVKYYYFNRHKRKNVF